MIFRFKLAAAREMVSWTALFLPLCTQDKTGALWEERCVAMELKAASIYTQEDEGMT